MYEVTAGLPTPPRWTRALLRRVLSPSSMCHMILGDLNEEFVADARRAGEVRARALYRRRAFGVVVYAVRDSLCLREWIRSSREGGRPDAAEIEGPSPVRRGIDPRFLATLVIAVSIGVNTLAYVLVSSSSPRWMVSVVGVVAFAFMIACAVLASGMVCKALRRRGERVQFQELRDD